MFPRMGIRPITGGSLYNVDLGPKSKFFYIKILQNASMRLDNARYLVIALTIAILSTASIVVQSARAEVSPQLSGTLSAVPSTVTVGHAITVSFNVTNAGNATANYT